ncbi:hypothetical protein NDU88_005921 [Pleurodeles waltl]|uniref:Uncharacterized protein n=1 Tax=Pleurodeles waltl TaxID=8319 RepID=A0AAV7W953_PLEWA|nr:hypothetical protein NDU88_005921 [Pleurodeles waltl]
MDFQSFAALHHLPCVRSPLSAVPGRPHATLQRCSATPAVYSERSHTMPKSRSETPRYPDSPAPQLGADLRRSLKCADAIIQDCCSASVRPCILTRPARLACVVLTEVILSACTSAILCHNLHQALTPF